MAYNHEYPYVDPSRYNDDWLLNKMKELIAEWSKVQQDWKTEKESFESLKAFVNNYFDNLDVQQEINNKLDAMAADGSLYEIIRKYTDPVVKEQNDKINVLKTRMDSFTSLPEGSTTGDAELTDIRVAYNGVTYPTAGDAVRAQASELSSEIDSVDNKAKYIATLENDCYVTHQGDVYLNTSSSHVMSNRIYLHEGETIYVRTRALMNTVSVISRVIRWTNLNRTCEALVISNTDDEKVYSYTANYDMEIVISSLKGWDGSYYISNTIIKNYTKFVANLTNDAYVNSKTGIRALGSSSSHVMSENIDLKKGTTIFVYCSALADVVSIISEKLTDNLYVPLVISDSDDVKLYSFLATRDMIIAISAFKTWTGQYAIAEEYQPYNDINSHIQYADFSLFKKFGVVGDSYASGEMYFNSQYIDNYSISWGQILARKCGNVCTNYSKGGLSTRTWLTSNKGLSMVLNNQPEDLYILALGINDYYGLGESYLGEISDIKDDYTLNSDTFYGNYGKIISQIMEHAPNSKLIISTLASRDSVSYKFNRAIIEIANHFGIGLIKQNEDRFFTSEWYRNNMVTGHPIAKVYSGMACAIKRMIEQCIIDNPNYFNDMFMHQ